MKRSKVRLDDILTEVNFKMAFYKASKGKRFRFAVRRFASNLDRNIQSIIDSVRTGHFAFGIGRSFLIFDPKQRTITAPRFEERVLHHALMNHCGREFDRWLLNDSFASQPGKGRLDAIRRARYFSSRYRFCIKLDVKKYFDSIDHVLLNEMLSRRFKCDKLLHLFRELIDSHHPNSKVGLPIGSLTSQHLANFYLGHLDRYAKETLGIGGYVRYMDDILVWAESASQIDDWEQRMGGYVEQSLFLKFKPSRKSQVANGVDFLGARIFPTHFTLSRRNRVRLIKRLRILHRYWRLGVLSDAQLQSRLIAIVAFSKAGGTKSWRFRQRMLELIPGE
jgi:RNA-directed DNA polymerase